MSPFNTGGEFTGGGSGGDGGFPGSAGTITLRKFPFAFDTPNLDTGASLYTPKVGDILYDAWIEVDTAWDGTTPSGDIGTTFPGGFGLFGNSVLTVLVDMTQADVTTDTGTILTSPTNLSLLMNNGGNSTRRKTGMGKFTTADPIKVVVSQDGTVTVGPAVIAGNIPATVPLTVVAGVSDQFLYAGFPNGTAPPELFTVAPGTYTTFADVMAAMGAAIGADHGEAFSTICNVTDGGGGVINCTMVVNNGAADNNNAITIPDHDVATGLGFSSNPNLAINGTGGPPLSAQGAAILYLVTATPA